MTQRKRDKTPPESRPQPATGGFADSGEETNDVQQIHRNILGREKGEPEEGFEPTPLWVWGVSVLVLFVMGFYLGRYGGSFSAVAHEVEQPGQASDRPAARIVKGDAVFAGVCQACHQASGLGIAGQYPPLVGSEWVLRDAGIPIRIVLFGLQGEITVKGSVFNNKMPQFHDKLSDDEIAAVLTHVRSSWGNASGAVTAADVDSVRVRYAGRGPWSSAELEALTRKKPS
jgi:mono/diheme cytochrome c family protein